MTNLYWTIYKNLEKEVLYLADLIHFDDRQLTVYSVRIADLLIRCAVEIESLIKVLFDGLNVSSVTTIGKMAAILASKWTLTKKQVSIVAPNMHFSDKYSTFCPYNYQSKDKNDFYSAYNAIKHDRAKNFTSKANLHFLMRILAALYILNIYYRNESFNLNRSQKLPDNTMDSNIFSLRAETCNPKFPDWKSELNDNALSAIYIIKPSNDEYSRYHKEFTTVFNRQKDVLIAAGHVVPNDEEEKGEDEKDDDISYSDIYKIAASMGGPELIKRISELEQPALKVHGLFNYEAVLNKSPIVSFTTQ